MPRSRFRCTPLLAALALFIPTSAHPQAPAIQPGALVRVGTTDADGRTHRRVGALVTLGDSVVIDAAMRGGARSD